MGSDGCISHSQHCSYSYWSSESGNSPSISSVGINVTLVSGGGHRDWKTISYRTKQNTEKQS